MKNFKFADPVIHSDLFELAEKYILNVRDKVNQKNICFYLSCLIKLK